ncbi:MAG: tetratricopeptide repeat protein [Pirellulales bacterium]
MDGRNFEGRSFDGRSSDRRNFEGRNFEGRSFDGRSFDGRSFNGRSSEGRSFDGRSFDGRRSGDWSNLAFDRGDRNWSGRFHDRHRHWHRGFSVNVFHGSPWGWSPWWGGWGPRWGWGGGFGPRWGWADWWGPWGYGPMAYRTGYWNYYNPYWQEPLVLGTTVVDYSQPIILPDDAGPADATAADDPAVAMALSQFDAARELFSRGDYQAALDGARLAMQHLPTDAALHEFVSLVHFAQGNYREAAGTVHSVLAAGPGWNWQTMRSLYPDVAVYTQHLRAAEAYRRANPESGDVRFLLAYHYMTTGHGDAAAHELRQVLRLEPNDTVATRLLQGLTGEAVEPTPAGAELPVPAGDATSGQLVPSGAAGAAEPVAGSLVGSWTAARDDGSKFALTLNPEGRFTWTVAQRDEETELTGTYSLADDLLVLESDEGGAMIGRVSQAGENGFQFRLVGAPQDDPGLTFEQ